MRRCPGIAAGVLALVLAACGGPSSRAPADAADAADAADVADAADDLPPAPEVFTHAFPDGRTGIATGAFDTFSIEHGAIAVEPRYTHVLAFRMSPMLPPSNRPVAGHGPLVLYTDDLDCLVFSPLDGFFEALIRYEDGRIRYGLHGDLASVPPGFTHRFVLVRGHGIQATLDRWGAFLRADRGRAVTDRYADAGLSYVGYWTDNGAAYYYRTADGLDEQDTLLAVKADLDARGVKIGYLQLDSWWYPKGASAGFGAGGLIEWVPQPAMFPEGLASFSARLGLPLVAHNRWFAKDNAYRARFPFVDGPKMAFPTTGDVFGLFMDDAKAWGVETYEQDWLWNQWEGVPWLREAPGRAAAWMGWMDAAARARGLTMQVCMPGPAHLMDVVDRPAVTTARTSVDHSTDRAKEAFWPAFHVVNGVAAALGVLPFKDNFATTEFMAEGEALVSVLSAGMVGIGDVLGTTNAALVARTCRADGLLLKPDRPAAPADAMFLDHRRPFLVSTRSERPGLGRWTYLAAFHLALEHPERTPEDRLFSALLYDAVPLEEIVPLPAQVDDWHVDLDADAGAGTGPLVAYDWRRGTASVVTGRLDLPPIERFADHAYVVLAPILDNGMALVGETSKFVTLADRRFVALEVLPDAVRATLAGVPGEPVTLRAYDTRAGRLLDPVTATVGADGSAVATLAR